MEALMLRSFSFWLRAALLTLLLAGGVRSEAQKAWQKTVTAQNGVVLLGYAARTEMTIRDGSGKTAWHGVIGHDAVTKIPLPTGRYTLTASDELVLITADLNAYEIGTRPLPALPVSNVSVKKGLKNGVGIGTDGGAQEGGAGGLDSHPLYGVGPLKVIPVPWVADATFAANPPSFVSSHAIFNNVPTRLKAVITGGTAPFTVKWDAGDGSAPVTLNNVTDAYSGAVTAHTYTGIGIGTQLRATITVTDSAATPATSTAYYYSIAADPSSRTNRINRAADEALWYMHGQIVRVNNYNGGNGEPIVDIGYVNGYTGGTVGSTSTFAICFENTGRSITGGTNFSHDPATDPYVEDLNRVINYLTDQNTLTRVNITGQIQHYASGNTLNPDTHGHGGTPNGFALVSNGYRPAYEGGMHLQAICQAGFVTTPVRNRNAYSSYYDLIGDFVDGFQWGQGESGYAEGGWRYDMRINYNDSDGSAAAWVAIGLRAAEIANTLTPEAPANQPAPLVVDPICIQEYGVWLNYDQVPINYGGTFGVTDYRLNTNKSTRYTGGFGYTSNTYGTNEGKTGGSLVGLKLLGYADNDPRVMAAESFLYRNFFNPDSLFNWSSARDAYGMYNIFKGLIEAHVSLLTDPLGTGGNDLDGIALQPFDWYGAFADFIVGPSAADLGHQMWPGTTGSATVSATSYTTASNGALDGHFEATAGHAGDWARGNSDYNAGINLVTAWDVAIMVGTVFTPGPVARIGHPDLAAGETFIPLQINGSPYNATFDPVGSSDLNPAARITHVHWEFGDGASDDYDLPVPGFRGGVVPPAPGVHPLGNQTLHSYGALGDYPVKLTVTDDAGNTNAALVTAHVVPAPYPPIAALDVAAGGASFQNGGTIGVLPDGTVTIQFDGTLSHNPDPSSVMAPKNAQGISAFAWEWPANPATGYNGGTSESPALFDEGASSGASNLNSGSKDGLQTYTFRFDPANFPSAISVGLQVTSNITPTAAGISPTQTIFRQFQLLNNAAVTPPVTNLALTNIANPSPNALIGQGLTYTLTVKNNGPKGAAKNVIVTDSLPAGVDYVSGTADNGGVVTNSGNAITATFASLPYGTTATITLTTTVNVATAGGTVLTATANASSTAQTPNSVSATATVTAIYPAPTLASLTPNSALLGSPDTTITLTGTGFFAASVAQWNGSNLATTFVSATQLTALLPAANLAAAASASVTVKNPTPGGGASNALTFSVTNPIPTLTAIAPNAALAGSGAFTLTVTGTNFQPSSTVRWNGSARTTTYVSASSLTAAIPASDVAGARTVPVTVFTPGPGGGETAPQTFTISNPAPTIVSISPNSATAGSSALTVAITGTNFVPASIGLLNGLVLPTTYVSPTSLNVTLSRVNLALPGVNSVSVSNPAPGGGSTATLPFTISGIAQLAVTSATAARSGGGVTVTVTIKNIGTATAPGSAVTIARLAGTGTITALPVSVGDLAAGGSATVTLSFPGSIAAGSRVLILNIVSGGKSLSASAIVMVP